MSSVVYVVQEPRRPDGRALVDISPAVEYGRIEVLLPSGDIVLSPAPVVAALRNGLRNYGDDDYLLALGDPSAIAIAAAVAAEHNAGRFRLLKWDRRMRRYIETRVDIRGGRDRGLRD